MEERHGGDVERGGDECRDGSEEEETLQYRMRACGELRQACVSTREQF